MRREGRHRVISAVAQRVTAGHAPYGQPAATPEAMALDRFQRIVGAGRVEAAARSEQRADGELVGSDQETDERSHVLVIFCHSLSSDSRRRALVTACTPPRTPTTISNAGNWARRCRKLSRINRRTRLRCTARRTLRAAIDIPRRAVPS